MNTRIKTGKRPQAKQLKSLSACELLELKVDEYDFKGLKRNIWLTINCKINSVKSVYYIC